MTKIIIKILLIISIFPHSIQLFGQENNTPKDTALIYKFDIKQEIGPAIWRITNQSLQKAQNINADYVLIHMNTYGGLLESADSIRTAILNCNIPVYVFIDNNAASAGALISIACDRIYMRKGANIGAATVVDQSGKAVPDKYQSYMRSMMRSTAESHGKDTIIKGQDTTYKWKRNPKIAESMVDPRIKVHGVIDSGKVLTFTTTEAIKHGFCEGQAENISEVIKLSGIKNYTIKEYKLTRFEKLMGWLVSPFLQGLLIMIIVMGIYFELQTPGIGFPLLAAIIAVIIYFAPLYLEGLAEHWEILLFLLGLALIALEIFAIPGFGVAGISGIFLVIVGLALAMVDNVNFEFSETHIEPIFKSFAMVISSMILSFVLSIYLTKKLITGSTLGFIELKTTQQKDDGYIGVENLKDSMVGKIGLAATVLRPSGKVLIDNKLYDAQSLVGFIEKGEQIQVLKYETGQLHVILHKDKSI